MQILQSVWFSEKGDHHKLVVDIQNFAAQI